MTKRQFTMRPREETSVFAESQVTYFFFRCYVTMSCAYMLNRMLAVATVEIDPMLESDARSEEQRTR